MIEHGTGGETSDAPDGDYAKIPGEHVGNSIAQRPESETSFRTISDAAPALVWVCRAPDGANIFFNRRWYEFTGQTEEDAAGYGWTKAVHPEDWLRIAPYWQRCQETGEVYEGEVRYRRHDGQYRWHIFRALPRHTAAGQLEAWYGVSIDVHDAKEAEVALHDAHARTTEVLESIGDIFYALDKDWKFTYVNHKTEQIWDRQRDELIGRSLWEVFPHAVGSASYQEHVKAMAGREPVHYEAFSPVINRWINVSIFPSANGGLSVYFQDIQARKEAEATLRESEERFRGIVNQSTAGIAQCDLAGNFTFANEKYSQMTGYSVPELLERNIKDVTHPEDFAHNWPLFAQLATDGTPFELEKQYVRKDGATLWVHNSLSALRDVTEQISGFLAVGVDITERKHAEEIAQTALEAVARAKEELEQRVQERTRELSERNGQLAEMSQMRQELLRQLVNAQEQERARISRDLHDDTGQQVTALLLGLRNLKTRPSVAGDTGAQQALTQVEALAAEIAQKSHRLSFTLRPTALDDQGLVEALRNYVEEWNRWSGLPADFVSIGMDGQRLPGEIESTIYRITQEALTNILKHAMGKDITQISVTLRRGVRDIVAIVEDNGAGFDVEATLDGANGKRRLGLFGMQERARLAGGTLTIDSTLGEGTTVIFRIPVSTVVSTIKGTT